MKLLGVELPIGRKKGVVDRIHAESIGILSAAKLNDALLPNQTGKITADISANIYSNSPYVNAAVRIVSNSLSTVPLKVYRKERSGNKVERNTGYIYNLLDYVNPHLTKAQLIEYTASWLMLNGNAYWAIEETPEEYSLYSEYSIYPLNPKYTHPVPDKNTGENGVMYKIGSESIWIPESKLIHFKNFSPHDYWHGHSNLNALETDIQVERYAKRQLANFFSHAAVVSGVLTIPTDPDPDEVIKIKREFHTQHGGSRNAYRVMVLTNGMQYESLKATMGDYQSVPILEQSLDIHATVMGVPAPILLGKSEGGKLIESEALMWKKTIMPLGKLIAETITKQLALPASPRGQYTDVLVVEFDYTNVEALRLQDLDRMRVEVAGVMAGVYKPNEIRRGRGLTDWDGESSEFGEMATPVFNAKQASSLAAAKASASLTLPGSQGGRDQSETGEAQMADTTGQRSVNNNDVLVQFFKDFLS